MRHPSGSETTRFNAPGRTGLAAAAVLALSATAECAWAQAPANVIRDIRPLVNISSQNPAPSGDPLALGIFDTGDFAVFVPPETNQFFGIGQAFPAPPGVGNVNNNFGVVGNPIDITVGGWLGGALGGPEVRTNPGGALAHIYSTDSRRPAMEGMAQTGLSPSLTYFNSAAGVRFSEPNIGTAFVAGTATSSPLVAEVDPTNGSYLPFASGNSNSAGIARASIPLDQTTSSISFYTASSGQVPTAALNFNPSFLTALTLTPDNTTGTGNFNRTNPALVNGASLANRGLVTITNTNNVFGGALTGNLNGFAGNNGTTLTNGTYLVDTGAPTTTQFVPAAPPNPAQRGLLGTDYLNGFGQYFDFSRSNLLLFGPKQQDDKNLIGPGVVFNVDRSTTGLSRTGVNQMSQFGIPPILTGPNPPGNPNGSPVALPSLAPEQATSIYKTDVTHSNALYVSGIDALNLTNADQMDGLSLGADPINRKPRLWFSVDRPSMGIPGAGTGFGHGVDGQAALGQAAADIFQSDTGRPMPIVGTNVLRYNQDLLGLGNNVGPAANAGGGRGNFDNLNDFDLQTQRGYVGAPVSQVQRNIDPPILKPGDVFNPGAGIAPNYGVRGDVYGGNFDTYFTLHRDSPSLAGTSPANILVNNPAGAGPGFHIFASFLTEGLQQQDAVDALAMQRPFLPLQGPLFQGTRLISPDLIDGVFDPNFDAEFDGIDPFHNAGIADLALFSLAPGSPSLNIFDPFLGRNLSAADIFITDFDGTFALYASAQSIGLDPFTDNVDGLDVNAVPEPAGTGLLLAAFGMLGVIRRQRRATR